MKTDFSDLRETSRFLEGLETTIKQLSQGTDKHLQALQNSFRRLKTGIADAVAPMANILAPELDRAAAAMTNFEQVADSAMQTLFEGGAAVDGEMKAATKSARALLGAANKTGRYLAVFDQITRLKSASTGSKGSSSSSKKNDTAELVPLLQLLTTQIKKIEQLLNTLDFTPLLQKIAALGNAFTAFQITAQQAVQGIWQGAMMPFSTWLQTYFAQTMTLAFQSGTAGLRQLGGEMSNLLATVQASWNLALTLVQQAMGTVRNSVAQTATFFAEKGAQIAEGFSKNFGRIDIAIQSANQSLGTLQSRWQTTFVDMQATAVVSTGKIQEALQTISTALSGSFANGWTSAWQSMSDSLKAQVNLVIGYMNRILSGVADGINSVVAMVNLLSFRVPDWVPILGGKVFGFDLSSVTPPQIPYLAQGAVLPANKPFLAVVGDQHHGTNVEAPLSTIQEAVALVMEDYISGNMAGHEATVSVLRQILEAVLGISIGDEMLSAAVSRQQTKMAVVKGGGW